MTTIKIDISSCEECPYAEVSRVFIADGWESVRKVHCLKLNEDVHSYLEWNDNAYVPNRCPQRIEEGDSE